MLKKAAGYLQHFNWGAWDVSDCSPSRPLPTRSRARTGGLKGSRSAGALSAYQAGTYGIEVVQVGETKLKAATAEPIGKKALGSCRDDVNRGETFCTLTQLDAWQIPFSLFAVGSGLERVGAASLLGWVCFRRREVERTRTAWNLMCFGNMVRFDRSPTI